MSNKAYDVIKPTIAIGIILVATFALYWLFIALGIFTAHPNKLNVVRYDATWFASIANYGYTYEPFKMSNLAFFPLFPYLWKFLAVDGLIISILNLVIFCTSFVVLNKNGIKNWPYLLALSSLPCFTFNFLPYSEACFFLFGMLVIIGYQKDSRSLLFIGLFACCLTRSVATFLVPAVILAEIFVYSSKKRFIENLSINLTACVAGILLVVLLQGIQTGKWFYYIEVQKYWQRAWNIPVFPFTTVSPKKILGIDSVALVIGVVAIYSLLKFTWQWTTKLQTGKGVNSNVGVCRSVIFSAVFLSAIAITDVGFTYYINGETNIQCMNRHLMCTSFAVCFLNWLNVGGLKSRVDILTLLVIILVGLFAFGVYQYVHHTVYYILFVVCFVLGSRLPQIRRLFYVLFLFNIFYIAIFYHDFLNGFWIG